MRDGRSDFGRFEQEPGRSWKSKRPLTFAEARDSVLAAARKIGAKGIVLSSNFTLGASGLPRGDRRRPDDQGVAVYFELGGRQLVMARDAYQRAEENMRSIGLALEAMAQLERHGGGVMLDKAFAGFTALPAPKRWWEVLGLTPDATAEQVAAAFRRMAAQSHPDQGGSHAAMAELNAARDAALRECKS
ncbi:J domain-containing protein [Brevundimonas sp.]|uniref:J domain-containing protein n=1 Tax=Brevundimonas sp. TaxID=1871086 RepID=UPI00257C681C|nr:J domain-containing protein [Brevundimonas sp.]